MAQLKERSSVLVGILVGLGADSGLHVLLLRTLTFSKAFHIHHYYFLGQLLLESTLWSCSINPLYVPGQNDHPNKIDYILIT